MSSWTKTWSGVTDEEEHKDQENETEPKLSLYKLSNNSRFSTQCQVKPSTKLLLFKCAYISANQMKWLRWLQNRESIELEATTDRVVKCILTSLVLGFRTILHQSWGPGSIWRVPCLQSCTQPLQKKKGQSFKLFQLKRLFNMGMRAFIIPSGMSADMLSVTVLDRGVALVKKLR